MKRQKLKIEDQDLLCKNGCGFYGNPSWNYLCSVCYRDIYIHKVKSLNNVSFEILQNTGKDLNMFEEKRNFIVSKTSNTVMNLFKLNKEISSFRENAISKEAKIRFENYLSKLRKSISNDVSKQIRKNIDDLEEAKFTEIEKHSVLVQDLYDKIKTDTISKGLSESQADELLAEIERFLTSQIYEWAFKPICSKDEIKDIELQKRIRSLHWITAEILDAAIDEKNEIEKRYLDDAVTAIIEMNTVICPHDKLDCIIRCCKAVSEAIQIHKKAVVSADDFFPTLILVLIRVNPTLLHSNIQFIMRFARSSLINSGETGYMFTNMCIAIEFINTLDHKVLNMTEQEFSDAMLGIKPVDTKLTIDAKFTALKILDNNGALLKNLDESSEILRNNLIQLEDETKIYESSFYKTLDDIRSELPLECVSHNESDFNDYIGVLKKSKQSWDHILDDTNDDLPTPLSPIKIKPSIDKENWEIFLN